MTSIFLSLMLGLAQPPQQVLIDFQPTSMFHVLAQLPDQRQLYITVYNGILPEIRTEDGVQVFDYRKRIAYTGQNPVFYRHIRQENPPVQEQEQPQPPPQQEKPSEPKKPDGWVKIDYTEKKPVPKPESKDPPRPLPEVKTAPLPEPKSEMKRPSELPSKEGKKIRPTYN
jgi:hypothetical protein